VVNYFDAVEEWKLLSGMEFSLRKLCRDKIQEITIQKAQFWKRREKVKWCNLGMKTHFFSYNGYLQTQKMESNDYSIMVWTFSVKRRSCSQQQHVSGTSSLNKGNGQQTSIPI
jgi:hypothetical protein